VVRFDFLDEREFYELMQVYRHAPLSPQKRVIEAFEAVKRYIREQVEKDEEE
jgi:hypothetical protein